MHNKEQKSKLENPSMKLIQKEKHLLHQRLRQKLLKLKLNKSSQKHHHKLQRLRLLQNLQHLLKHLLL